MLIQHLHIHMYIFAFLYSIFTMLCGVALAEYLVLFRKIIIIKKSRFLVNLQCFIMLLFLFSLCFSKQIGVESGGECYFWQTTGCYLGEESTSTRKKGLT